MRNNNMNGLHGMSPSRLSARAARDVTFGNGLIKLVELETASDFCDKVTPFDSNLQLGDNVHTCHVGWRALTWSRMISWKYWQKDWIVIHDDISVDNRHADLLAELRDNYSREITLKNLSVGVTKLSISNCDVTYLMSKVSLEDKNAWIIAINMRNKTMEDLAPVSVEERFYFDAAYHPCTLSKYLNISPVFLQMPNQYGNLRGLRPSPTVIDSCYL